MESNMEVLPTNREKLLVVDAFSVYVVDGIEYFKICIGISKYIYFKNATSRNIFLLHSILMLAFYRIIYRK